MAKIGSEAMKEGTVIFVSDVFCVKLKKKSIFEICKIIFSKIRNKKSETSKKKYAIGMKLRIALAQENNNILL